MPSVLSTKMLTPAQKNLILNLDFSLVEYNAIQTTPLSEINHLKNQRFENAIITSQKSVKIINELKLDFKQVFCVGKKTQQALQDLGYKVVEVTNYGQDLAEIISTNYAHLSFNFFCGKLRNEAIPNQLKQHQISFTEHQLYETKLNPKKFEREFEAILFFSPSAVRSFFNQNKAQHSQLICIGSTTAQEAKKISKNVHIAKTTSIESCIVKLNELFLK
ncbi:uroporphyrinogen-III synthase [Psychroflexus maritimus]|uniref:Uroporphyrinogen-III synthase n=1 Tax=Psychroflexus maritimus TaxID=2714865 RepID=A0A967E6N8_9FLAO|nr:uroporphyrinogen-III synthase [Psychroflexus maritimus]NGZ89946.1 uroporphyrinogen-III synthase [Psychroflexus maritimus]